MPCVSALPLLVAGAAWEVGGVWVPEVEVVVGDLESDSGVMVDWEEEREKVLARGARWVSLSSVRCQLLYPSLTPSFDRDMPWIDVLFVSFQDILAYISSSCLSF